MEAATANPSPWAVIESWFGKPKDREVWLNMYEAPADARAAIAGYVDRYHHWPHSGLNYRIPNEVREPGRMDDYRKPRPEMSDSGREQVSCQR
jgi:hypothetical protein